MREAGPGVEVLEGVATGLEGVVAAQAAAHPARANRSHAIHRRETSMKHTIFSLLSGFRSFIMARSVHVPGWNIWDHSSSIHITTNPNAIWI
jgi:hypothetical protein